MRFDFLREALGDLTASIPPVFCYQGEEEEKSLPLTI
jgi:hypothetical protein